MHSCGGECSLIYRPWLREKIEGVGPVFFLKRRIHIHWLYHQNNTFLTQESFKQRGIVYVLYNGHVFFLIHLTGTYGRIAEKYYYLFCKSFLFHIKKETNKTVRKNFLWKNLGKENETHIFWFNSLVWQVHLVPEGALFVSHIKKLYYINITEQKFFHLNVSMQMNKALRGTK